MTSLENFRIKIRPAGVGDASLAAKLIYLSMGSLADYLFDQNSDQIESSLKQLFARNAGRFGYKLAVVAEVADEPVGLLVASAGDQLTRLDAGTIPHFFPVLGIKHALRFIWRGLLLPGGKEAQNDEYYLSNLGVLPTVQGRGIGSYVLEYAEQIARSIGLLKCSLIAGSHNDKARRLYERIGYQVCETVQSQNENLGYYRMVKVL